MGSALARCAVVSLLFLALQPCASAGPTQMSAFSYYVGHWSCTAGRPGRPVRQVDVTFAYDSAAIFRTTVLVHADRRHPAFAESQLATWDAAHRRFVQLSLGSDGSWAVDNSHPWTGKRQRWINVAVDSGKLGREELVQVDRSRYIVENFPTLHARTPSSVSHCMRR